MPMSRSARVGVLPRHHEHRVALVDQVLHHRVARAQVEDVVLHDPRRHDQQRLGMDRLGRRRVLDQLDQLVAEHHLAGGHGHALADLEVLGAGRCRALQRALDVLDHVLQPAHQVLALLGLGQRQHLGVRRQVVRRRAGVQQHAHRELQQLGVVVGDAVDVAHRVVHQRGAVLVGARVDVERELRPVGRGEASVGLAFRSPRPATPARRPARAARTPRCPVHAPAAAAAIRSCLAGDSARCIAQSAQAVVNAVGARPAVICASWARNSRSKSWGWGAPLRLVAIVVVSGCRRGLQLAGRALGSCHRTQRAAPGASQRQAGACQPASTHSSPLTAELASMKQIASAISSGWISRPSCV